MFSNWRATLRNYIGVIAVAVGFALVAAGLVATFDPLHRGDDPGRYSPLGPYPVQDVGMVEYTVNDVIDVTGEKCVKGDKPVEVSGVFGWQRVNPPGFSIMVGEGVATREPGCTVQQFENAIPPQVVTDVQENGPSVWKLFGRETPIAIDKRTPDTITFETEPFELRP